MADDSRMHPQKDELIAFGLGTLDPDAAERIAEHLDSCHDCSETIVSVQDDTFVSLVRKAPSPAEEKGREPADAEQPSPEVTIDLGSGLTDGAIRPGDLPQELRDHPRYEILELIGRGGMGDVYKAQHKVMNRVVALKVIKPELVKNDAAVERFRREVQAAASLRHPNIVTAHDAEQAGNLHFLVMEYVDGTNLDEFVSASGRLSLTEACDYVRQAAEGLQHAHDLGMVHRDIKPHNLMIERQTGTIIGHATVVKILDFGLANFANEVAAGELSAADEKDAEANVSQDLPPGASIVWQLTQMGTMMGTPDYIAPEQAEDAHTVDIRADIYSLGCTFYTLLTGRAPFGEGSVLDKIKAHTQEEARPMSDFRDDVPQDVEAVLVKMMAKDPAERYQTPAEVAEALSSVTASFQLGEVEAKDRHAGCSSPRRRRPLVLTAVAVLFLTLLAAAATVFYIQTDNGVVRVEVTDPSLQVTISGQTITTSDNGKPLTIRAGEQKLVVSRKDSDFQLITDSFNLRRGDDIVLKVDLLPGEVVVSKDGERFDAKDFSDSSSLAGNGQHSDKSLQSGEPSEFLEYLALVELDNIVRELGGKSDPSIEVVRNAKKSRPEPSEVRFDAVVGGRAGASPALLAEFETWLPRAAKVKGAAIDHVGQHDQDNRWERFLSYHTDQRAGLVHLTLFGIGLSPGGGGIRAWRLKIDVDEWPRNQRPSPEHATSIVFGVEKSGMQTLSINSKGYDASGFAKSFLSNIREAIEKNPGLPVFLDADEGVDLSDPKIAEGFDEVRRVAKATGAFVRLGPRLADITPPPEKITPIATLEGHYDEIRDLQFFDQDSKLATSSADMTFRIWNVKTGKEIYKRQCPHWVSSLAISPDGKLAALGFITVRSVAPIDIIDLETKKQLHRLAGPPDLIFSLDFSPDGKRVLAGGRGKAMVWEVESGEKLYDADLHSPQAGIHVAKFSPDGTRFLTASHDVIVHDAVDGKPIHTIESPNKYPGQRACFSSDGKMLLVAAGKELLIHDVETGQRKKVIPLDEHVHDVRFLNADRQTLVSSRDNVLRILDTHSSELLYQQKLDGLHAKKLAVSSDGALLATGGGVARNKSQGSISIHDYDIRLWQLPESVWANNETHSKNEIRVMYDERNGNPVFEIDGESFAQAVNGLARIRERFAENAKLEVVLDTGPEMDRTSLEDLLIIDGVLKMIAVTGVPVRLAPALQIAREAAWERNTRTNVLNKIGIAMHTFSEKHDLFPPGDPRKNPEWFDDTGRPHLSWRVHLLPIFGQEELYGRFRLNEPWDSPHNKPLLAEMPAIYKTTDAPTKTTLLTVVGEGTAYEGQAGLSLKDFKDGMANTALVVDAGRERVVPWTKPEDLPFDSEDPIRAFGTSDFGDMFLALMADASVKSIPYDTAPESLRALFTRAAGDKFDKNAKRTTPLLENVRLRDDAPGTDELSLLHEFVPVPIERRKRVRPGMPAGDAGGIDFYSVTDLTFSLDGKLAFVTGYFNIDSDLRIFGTATGETKLVAPGSYFDVRISPDGRWFVTGGGQVELWDLAKLKKVRQMDMDEKDWQNGGGAAVFTPDGGGCIIACTDRRKALYTFARYWDLETGEIKWQIPGKSPRIAPDGESVYLWCPPLDGDKIDARGSPVIERVRLATGERIKRKSGNFEVFHGGGESRTLTEGFALSADGRLLAAGSAEGPIVLWDTQNQDFLSPYTLQRAHGHAFSSYIDSFVDSGHRLISYGDDGTVRIWKVAEPKENEQGHPQMDQPEELLKFRLTEASPQARHKMSLQVSPDERFLFAAGETKIGIWEIATGKEVYSKEVLHSPRRLAVSPDGRMLLTGMQPSNDTLLRPNMKFVHLWQLPENVWPKELEASRGQDDE